jgi:hypothetical protein
VSSVKGVQSPTPTEDAAAWLASAPAVSFAEARAAERRWAATREGRAQLRRANATLRRALGHRRVRIAQPHTRARGARPRARARRAARRGSTHGSPGDEPHPPAQHVAGARR